MSGAALGKLLLRRFAVGPLLANCYTLGAHDDERILLVDPGDDAPRLLEALSDTRRTLEAILLTHAHFDHVGALAEVLDSHPVPVYLHPADLPWLENLEASAAAFGMTARQPVVTPLELQHGQVLSLAGLELHCLHTPGHAPGHVAFWIPEPEVVLSGDALFQGSIGRTDLPMGNSDQLLASIREQLLVLPGSTSVFPGHGPETTIAQESRSNPFLG